MTRQLFDLTCRPPLAPTPSVPFWSPVWGTFLFIVFMIKFCLYKHMYVILVHVCKCLYAIYISVYACMYYMDDMIVDNGFMKKYFFKKLIKMKLHIFSYN